MNFEQLPQGVKVAGDVGSWGAVFIGFFSNWSPVITGMAGILAILWTGAQFYSWIRRKGWQ